MADVDHVKIEKKTSQIGSFQSALEEAKRRAREAKPKKAVPREDSHEENTRLGNAGDVTVRNGKPVETDPPTTKVYTGLKPARKNKYAETVTGKRTSSDSSGVSSPHLTLTDEGSTRPFAPAKKPKRTPAKYDEM